MFLGTRLLFGGDASQDSVLVRLEDDWKIRQLLRKLFTGLDGLVATQLEAL